jgi:hypothetical protein
MFRIQKIINLIFYFLVLTLPFQNLISQVLVSNLGLPTFTALYKEVLVGLLAVLLCIFIAKQVFNEEFFKKGQVKNLAIKLLPIILFLILNVLAILSFFINQNSINQFAFGYRFELYWLGFFAVIASYLNFIKQSDSEIKSFRLNSIRFLLVGLGLVIMFSFVQLGVGIKNVNSFFINQEADGLINQTLCHRIDFGLEECRLNSTFSSPNHFAAYLSILIPFLFLILFSGINHLYDKSILNIESRLFKDVFKTNLKLFFYLIFGLIISSGIFIFLSYSRFSWLANAFFVAFLISSVFFYWIRNYKPKLTLKIFKLSSFLIILFPLIFGIFIINIDPDTFNKSLPDAIAKPSSSDEHYRHTQASLQVLRSSQNRIWYGYGLGSSGPAANERYQDLEENLIIKNHLDIGRRWLRVWERVVIPENWFLQVFINGGLFYGIIYLILILLPLTLLKSLFKAKKLDEVRFFVAFSFFSFFAILIGNLFLHLFENQTVALYWSISYLILNLTNRFI